MLFRSKIKLKIDNYEQNMRDKSKRRPETTQDEKIRTMRRNTLTFLAPPPPSSPPSPPAYIVQRSPMPKIGDQIQDILGFISLRDPKMIRSMICTYLTNVVERERNHPLAPLLQILKNLHAEETTVGVVTAFIAHKAFQ